MSAREEFGEPDATDIMLAIGDLYLARGALIVAVRALLSGIPHDKAIAVLQAVVVECFRCVRHLIFAG